jgi:hypothetical protein
VGGTCECGNEPSGSIKCGELFKTTCKQVSFSRRTLLHEVGMRVSKCTYTVEIQGVRARGIQK